MFEKKCKICGKVFPPGTPPAKKFCDECAVINKAEKKHEQNMRYKEKLLAEKEEKKPATYALHQPRMLSGKDKAYCGKCIYRGRFTEDYLCNYILITGHRRGCKAGYGCGKRELITGHTDEEGRKQCERCGAMYIGTKSTRYCMACRKEALRANQRHMMEVKMGKPESDSE